MDRAHTVKRIALQFGGMDTGGISGLPRRKRGSGDELPPDFNLKYYFRHSEELNSLGGNALRKIAKTALLRLGRLEEWK